MLNNRFKVTVRYRNGFDNNTVDTNGNVKSVSSFANPSFETAFFYFNDPNNVEMMVKILAATAGSTPPGLICESKL